MSGKLRTELQQIIGKTLRKDRDERYHSAQELLEALKGLRHKLEFQAESERSAFWLLYGCAGYDRPNRPGAPTASCLLLRWRFHSIGIATWRQRLPPRQEHRCPSVGKPQRRKRERVSLPTGIHDELLSDLSKIADLKVISRTSVMQYKSGIKRNLKEIAQQLGVSNVVEGSVGRVGKRVRV